MSNHQKTSLQNMMTDKPTRPRPQVTYLPESGQLVRALAHNQVPERVHADGKTMVSGIVFIFTSTLPSELFVMITTGIQPDWLSGYLEVVDIPNQRVRYIPVPG